MVYYARTRRKKQRKRKGKITSVTTNRNSLRRRAQTECSPAARSPYAREEGKKLKKKSLPYLREEVKGARR